MKRLGVGIIGVTPGKSWAALAHIPALQSLCDLYEVVAVSTRSRTRAAAAAAAFGVPNAFDNHDELVRHSAVDLVVVTVRVPESFGRSAPPARFGAAPSCWLKRPKPCR